MKRCIVGWLTGVTSKKELLQHRFVNEDGAMDEEAWWQARRVVRLVDGGMLADEAILETIEQILRERSLTRTERAAKAYCRNEDCSHKPVAV